MGGGRCPTGEHSSDADADASSSDESQVTKLPAEEQCADRLSDYARARALLNSRDFFVRRYKPGYFIDDEARDEKFEIPETTTLLLIGDPGKGKALLVSQIKSVFDDIWSTPAPDDFNMTPGWGTLQEHMILKDSTSICVFYTPCWPDFFEENHTILQDWMKNGVCHGNSKLKLSLNKRRMVNYVILNLDAVSILESIDRKDDRYMDMVHDTFNYPFLSFRGNRPAVVVTNGDRLSSAELSSVLDFIKELLGIPLYQIFCIPGIDDYHTELNIVALLRYCLEKADQGLPLKQKGLQEEQELKHVIWKGEIYSDLVIDVLIVCICFWIFWNFGRSIGLFSLHR
ncbi:P-loop containing nucleoside triphosphate hydrolases superfamily protein [Rhynchospora pubera]|uniref:P-loop containing nucleoside triphosphate hydrolases superfamily protein n=1 Tax=Rhynchospora pubera TaxID=906938 RepID=A0AAV8CDT7_9POAL|nr:P-loop containing nucleoside triphosphate hydrolases superfamily protein [Rhynchospora pubera]